MKLELTKWAFIPGPETLSGSIASTELYEGIPRYEPDAVARRLLNYPGMTLTHPAKPSWWDWSARCEFDGGVIEIGFSLFETEPLVWGGSEFEAVCELEALLQLWSHLREQFAGIWLHNDQCIIHTMESFKLEMVESFGLHRQG